MLEYLHNHLYWIGIIVVILFVLAFFIGDGLYLQILKWKKAGRRIRLLNSIEKDAKRFVLLNGLGVLLIAWILIRFIQILIGKSEGLVDVITLFITAFMTYEFKIMSDTNHMEMSNEINKEDSKMKANLSDAITQSKTMAMRWAALKDESWTLEEKRKAFQEFYAGNDFAKLKDVAFHYEYLGQLIYRKKLDFDVTFATITFPDSIFAEFFTEDDTNEKRQFLEDVREFTPDFWQGVEFMYASYCVRREFDRTIKEEMEGKKIKKHSSKAYAFWRECFDKMPL